MFNLKAYLRLLDVLTRSRAKSKLAENTRRLSIVLVFENSRYWWWLLYIGSSSSHTTVNPGRTPHPVDSGQQVVPESGKQATQTYNYGIVVVPKSKYLQQESIYHTYPRKSRGKWIIIGGVVALTVILAAVLGGLLGSPSKTNRECHRRLGVSDIRFDYNDSS